MRWATILVLAIVVLLTASSSTAAPPISDSGPHHIVFSRNAASAGEQVEMRLLPPVPPGVRVTWPVAAGTTRLIYSARYRAPYVIPAGTPPAVVSVGISGAEGRTTVSAEITLLPSSVPGAEDCLGPGQSFSTTAGTIVPDYMFADELPELIHSVPPDYPRSDVVREIEDTIPVSALVCRSGHVLDAVALDSYVKVGDLQPIPHDPKMVEAAVAAVRQYVFKPATVSGQPIATWVHVPVRFHH